MLRNFSKKYTPIQSRIIGKIVDLESAQLHSSKYLVKGKFMAVKLPLNLANKLMKKEFEAKNLVQFRLTGTPDGNLLVSFYHLDTFNQEAVNWYIAGLLVENKMNARVLYEGNLQNNTHHQTAIYILLKRVNMYVNCVRIERVK